jgi:hypothetical protein
VTFERSNGVIALVPPPVRVSTFSAAKRWVNDFGRLRLLFLVMTGLFVLVASDVVIGTPSPRRFAAL